MKKKDDQEQTAAHQKQLTRDQIKLIMGQIISGIKALHEKKMIHEDIGTRNIFIDNIDGYIHAQIGDLDSISNIFDPNHDFDGLYKIIISLIAAARRTKLLHKIVYTLWHFI